VIVTIAWKSLAAHPVRTAVLGIGFGLGVSVMATLLGVGDVVLEQARSPRLLGGGDLLVTGTVGRVTSARFVLDGLLAPTLRERGVVAASPRRRADLYLAGPSGTLPVRAHGGVPSLERAIGDPETAQVAAWVDSEADGAWARPHPPDLLRDMDRFHPIPDVPARAGSWAEWLYFKGQSGDVQFYVTFLFGPREPDGRRAAGTRLQLDRGGQVTSYGERASVDEATLLAGAPDVTIGRSSVRLDGMRYRIALDLPEDDHGGNGTGRRRVAGEIAITAAAGRSLPPLEVRGAGGWVSGYVVPVMSGALSGSLTIDGAPLALDGLGYHDHNWGFWEGVSWRWGQVQHESRSYLYGRIHPPADAADPERMPSFLVALDPDGIVGFSQRVTIEETDDPATGRPMRVLVRGDRGRFTLTLDLDVERAIVTRGALGSGLDFFQLRARYRVTGRVGDERVAFTAHGAAETFRGR
jgi:hypothetical protein